MFTQLFIQAQIKKNTKAPRHWPLCGEFTGDTQMDSNAEMFPLDDVIMNYSTPEVPLALSTPLDLMSKNINSLSNLRYVNVYFLAQFQMFMNTIGVIFKE